AQKTKDLSLADLHMPRATRSQTTMRSLRVEWAVCPPACTAARLSRRHIQTITRERSELQRRQALTKPWLHFYSRRPPRTHHCHQPRPPNTLLVRRNPRCVP